MNEEKIKEFIYLHYYKKLTYREIGEMFNTTKQNIHYHLKNYFSKHPSLKPNIIVNKIPKEKDDQKLLHTLEEDDKLNKLPAWYSIVISNGNPVDIIKNEDTKNIQKYLAKNCVIIPLLNSSAPPEKRL